MIILRDKFYAEAAAKEVAKKVEGKAGKTGLWKSVKAIPAAIKDSYTTAWKNSKGKTGKRVGLVALPVAAAGMTAAGTYGAKKGYDKVKARRQAKREAAALLAENAVAED